MGLPKEIAEFMASYGVTSDEIWKIPQGSAYAVKHKALERVAAEQKIIFDRPAPWGDQDLANGIAAMVVFARMGDREEWATGEASPRNNKNAYALAMAEKRAKDRCVLKLLQAHGALYSEEEADEFKRQNPHVTTPGDIIGDPIERDQYGEPVDNIPNGDPNIQSMPKAKSRAEFSAMQNEIRLCKTVKELQAWADNNKNRVSTLPSDWSEILRGIYRDQLSDLRAQKPEAA